MIRAFLALEIPDAARAALVREIDRLRGELPGWRWARGDSAHLTLRFLGDTDPDRVATDGGAWAAAAAALPPFRFGIRGLGAFPPRGRPRVLWAGIAAVDPPGALEAAAAALEAAARDLGYAPETRAFRPHMTLARARREGGASRPPDGRALDAGTVLAREVVLFRSELLPGGARHEPLARYAFGGDGTP